MSDLPLPEDAARDKEAMKHAQHEKVVNPLDGLPEHLKHPSSFMKVEKAMIETLTCGKTHSDPIAMQACSKCCNAMMERRVLLEKLGFRNLEQYFAWRKTHQEIKKRVPLDKYNYMVKKGENE